MDLNEAFYKRHTAVNIVTFNFIVTTAGRISFRISEKLDRLITDTEILRHAMIESHYFYRHQQQQCIKLLQVSFVFSHPFLCRSTVLWNVSTQD